MVEAIRGFAKPQFATNIIGMYYGNPEKCYTFASVISLSNSVTLSEATTLKNLRTTFGFSIPSLIV